MNRMSVRRPRRREREKEYRVEEWSETGERMKESETGNQSRPSPVISRSLRTARGITGWQSVWIDWESVVSRLTTWRRRDGGGDGSGGVSLGLSIVSFWVVDL